MFCHPDRLIVALFAICVSCQSGVHSNDEANADHKQGVEVKKAVAGADRQIVAGVGELAAHYFHVKDGLVSSNSQFAADGAAAMHTDLNQLNKLASTRNNPNLRIAIEQMLDMAEHIAKGADEISHQREHFNTLSACIISLVKSYGYKSPVYSYQCTLGDEKTLVWLCPGPDSRSPYTGKAESCTVLQEIIR